MVTRRLLICARIVPSGSLFAVVTAVQVLSAAFASVLYNEIFREALKHHIHPGVAFILMGIVGLLPVPLVT